LVGVRRSLIERIPVGSNGGIREPPATIAWDGFPVRQMNVAKVLRLKTQVASTHSDGIGGHKELRNV
jgi:hypothetical protein